MSQRALLRTASGKDAGVCRKFDLDAAEACHAYGVRLLPYGMLAGGFLSGKYLGGAHPEGARHTSMPDFQPRYATQAMHEAAQKYTALAESKGLSCLQLAVAWCASPPPPLPPAPSPQHPFCSLATHTAVP